MKVWLLDNGSIVIEHTQFMWNVPGPQVRIPSYGVLVEHDDGLSVRFSENIQRTCRL